MTLAHPGFLAIESPTPTVHLVRVSGDLDAATANRLLRIVDARGTSSRQATARRGTCSSTSRG
ncbi:hypothetical protein ACFQV8_13565 [Pseudonocardia benzenivorans]